VCWEHFATVSEQFAIAYHFLLFWWGRLGRVALHQVTWWNKLNNKFKSHNLTSVHNHAKGFDPFVEPISNEPLNSTHSCTEMTVAMAMGISCVCMSRHWKTEKVTYRIRVQTSARFTFLMFLNLIDRWYVQSVQNVFSTLSWLQNLVAIEPCIRIGCMSN
jgi:hypothetical protein